MHRILFAALALCLALFVGFAVSDAADVNKGKDLAKKCSCHKSKKDLDGMAEKTFIAKMTDYKNGKGDPKSMIGISKSLSDQDIKDLAAYYSSLK